MKTIASRTRWHLWLSRYQARFELWANWDYHNYIVSITIFTFQVGFEWVWIKQRDQLRKGGYQIVWHKNP